jgi:hypothetical protein
VLNGARSAGICALNRRVDIGVSTSNDDISDVKSMRARFGSTAGGAEEEMLHARGFSTVQTYLRAADCLCFLNDTAARSVKLVGALVQQVSVR